MGNLPGNSMMMLYVYDVFMSLNVYLDRRVDGGSKLCSLSNLQVRNFSALLMEGHCSSLMFHLFISTSHPYFSLRSFEV